MRHRNNFPYVVRARWRAIRFLFVSNARPRGKWVRVRCARRSMQLWRDLYSNQLCLCTWQRRYSISRSVYILGTARIGRTLKISEPKDFKISLCRWHYEVLKTPEARYIARQVCWVLTVERQPAYYLMLSDIHDLDSLIEYLNYDDNDLGLFVGSSSLAGGIELRFQSPDS